MELTATPQPTDPAAIRAGAGQPPGGASRWRRLGPDLALALILGVAAFLVRRGGLPTHGLWLDDATLSAGINAPLSQIFTVSVDHPGFTAFLGGWSWLTGGSDASLAYPALIAGTLSAPALFLLLRRADYARSISVLLGAALVAAEADIVYSGRVKTYAIDLLVVLLLAFILPKLVRTWWRWPVGVAWVIGSVALATVSGFALFAVALAGVIIVLHPDYDSEVRIPAVVVQEAAVIGLFVIEGNTYNRGPIEETWRQTWDGFISFHGNPLTFAGDVLDHLKQLTEAYPGGPAWLAMTLILIALAGLAVGAWKGRERIRARYLLLILLAAFAGGVAGKFPFGPIVANPISSGHRVTLWLIPVIAMGLAIALRVLRGAIADRGRRLVVGFDVVAYLGAAAILVVALAGDTQAYPYPGAEPATSFIESTATSDDAVLLPWPALYSFAAETDLGTGVTKAPTSAFGYDPTFSDPSIHPFGTTLSPFDVKQAVDGAKRVFVYRPDSFNSIENESASTIVRVLKASGFRHHHADTFGDAQVEEWGHGDVSALPSSPSTGTSGATPNLRPSDLPDDWRFLAASTPVPTLLDCLGVGTKSVKQSSVVTGTTGTGLVVVSDVTRWPDAASAQSAFAAIAGPRGTRCAARASSSGESHVSALRAAAPVSGSNAVAFKTELVPTGSQEGSPTLHGGLVFLVEGRSTAALRFLALDGSEFPRNLLSQLSASLDTRLAKGG